MKKENLVLCNCWEGHSFFIRQEDTADMLKVSCPFCGSHVASKESTTHSLNPVAICMNDYPIAIADTEEEANEAKEFLQKLWKIIDAEKPYSFTVGALFIHTHKVPLVSNRKDYYELFLDNHGGKYQYILNSMHTALDPEKAKDIIKDGYDETWELFQKFLKTYPEVENFIKWNKEGKPNA